MTTWKDELKGKMPADWAEEIDRFEGQMELRRVDKIDEKVFAETRLRRGAYGQRYDNGHRHDGIGVQPLEFPADLTKGPDTEWDAPGMHRIKVPFGGLNPDQLEVLAELAEEYSDGILHVTTRQDFQLHFVHIEDTPDLMRRLAAVGITTREACGNSVRNVTACPMAGVCYTETFDVTPYSHALFEFLLGHDDVQDFGRKFKPAFSGCEYEACGLVKMHDMGYLAQVREVDGQLQRGFRIYVGGGLGTVTHQAKILSEFVPEEELLPVTQAVCRVFTQLGEKRNRNRARLKFLVANLGIDEFKKLVFEEREQMTFDPRWTAYLDDLDRFAESPDKGAGALGSEARPSGFDGWFETNVYHQRQAGYATVTVNLPLGDLSVEQAFELADIARSYTPDTIRTTVEQNIVLRWVPESQLTDLYQALQGAGLSAPGAGTIVDITACPGTDTCKLGIAASRGLAGELRTRLAAQNGSLDQAVKDLRVKISGCFNSCGQHHVADIGFFGNSRRRQERLVPHFQVVLGGKWKENAGSYGLAVGAVPSKAVPDVLESITARYAAERDDGESFQDWVARLGKVAVKLMLQPFTEVPSYELDTSYFSDWGDPREFTLGDLGVGECAGEVVSLFSITIVQAEGTAFEALVALEAGRSDEADKMAYRAMLTAAKALVLGQTPFVGDEPSNIVNEFRSRFYDTELFFDPFAKGKFAQYLFRRHQCNGEVVDSEAVTRLVEEANLFIEAAHACDARQAGPAASSSLL